jgi:hypothetical protein
MSTKNLARTAIEVGRRGYNKWERNYSHRQERARARQWLSRVRQDPEVAEALVIKPRPHVMRDQDDKLSPVRKFLRSRVGRRWDDVHSEIVSRFDTRTIAGFHILYGHILEHMVEHWWEEGICRYGGSPKKFYPGDLVVNEEGILTEIPKPNPARERARKDKVEKERKDLLEWLDNRLVKKVGDDYFWMNPAKWNWEICQRRNAHQHGWPYSYAWSWRWGIHRCSPLFEHKLVDGSVQHRFPWLWEMGDRLEGPEYYRWSQLSKFTRQRFDYARMKSLMGL